MPVKSTYNFVPAPKESEVFKPDWADQVSHDIPFKDGESGELTLKITAKTPIFIRNGHIKDETDNEFSHRDLGDKKKEYFIPATSLKGMIRNVLEIMSFSRMSKVNNHRHAVRQIMRTQGTVVDEQYGLTDQKENIYAGWLVLDTSGQYQVIDCGKPRKIRYTELDNNLDIEPNNQFKNQFGNDVLSNLDTDFSARTAMYKYENIMPSELQYSFEKHPLDDVDQKQSSWKSKYQPLDYVRFSTESSEDTFFGTIVCTGQAMTYTNMQARKGEYVFLGNKSDKIKNGVKYPVLKETMETFLFINRDNKSEELEDWTFWKRKAKEGIPVFFRKRGKNVLDMGLTFMYKQPVQNFVKDSVPIRTYPKKITKTYEPDLAETIFGFISKEKSLKGRVLFSSAILQGEPQFLSRRVQNILLSTPRSSFFPFYQQQSGRNGITTHYNNYNFKPALSGFKRYPVHNTNKLVDTTELNSEMVSSFIPIKEDAEFEGQLRFHNLRKAEIGALISAITFHKSGDCYFHNIGYAKPFGYGKVKIEVNCAKLEDTESDYLKAFEFEMLSNNESWHASETVKEFLAMAINPTADVEENLDYPDVSEFQSYKNNGNFLQRYSILSNSNMTFEKHISNDEIMAYNKLKNSQEKKVKTARKSKFNEIIHQAKDEILQHNFTLADKLYRKADALLHDGQHEERINKLYTIRYEAELIAAWESAQSDDNKVAYKDFRNKYPNSKYDDAALKRIKQLEAEHLSASNIQFPTEFYHQLKTYVNPLISNKLFRFSKEQTQDLITAIGIVFDNESKNLRKSDFHKKKKIRMFNQHPWTEICKWIGQENALKLYNDLIGKVTE